ncbi:MAG: spore cortex biosynthesis protein YabQ [Clostridia bacterium]|nr:spore cortex biosynthesis protein YabQ [Clostridia bacterium]
MINNLDELPIFLVCLWSGLLLGAVYELLALVRSINRTAIAILADIAFGIILFAVCAYTLAYCDNGHLRLYSVIGFAAGFILFRIFPAKIIRRLVARVSSFAAKHKKNKEIEVPK